MAIILPKLVVLLILTVAFGAIVFGLTFWAAKEAVSVDDHLDAPTLATLKNGLLVVNFGSPHPFVFDDGTVLGRADPETVKLTSIKKKDRRFTRATPGTFDAKLQKDIPAECEAALRIWYDRWAESKNDIVVIVPFMLLDAINEAAFDWMDCIQRSPFRTICSVDRETKLNSSTVFYFIGPERTEEVRCAS